MDKVLTDNIWQQVAPIVRKEKRKVAALAYVTSDTYIKFGKGDTLICDASDHKIKNGETSAKILKKFFKSGAQLFSCANLHAKVLVFGRNVLIGSNNLSASSAILRELALLSSRSAIRSQAAAFIYGIKGESIPIDEKFIARIAKFKVNRRGFVPRKRKGKLIQLGNRTWLTRTYQLDPERYKKEEPWVKDAEQEVKECLADQESDIGWIRWVGRGRFRDLAKEGDTLIDMNSIRHGKQVIISAPTPILKRQNVGNWTRFYYEIPTKDNEMSWTDFSRRLAKVGIKHIKKNSSKELTKRDAALIDTIWEEYSKNS